MPAQRIQYILEVPYFYFVIVAAAGEHASRRMKINGTHWSIMLFKSIKQRANSVIPKLDCTTDCYQCLELIGIVDRGAITCADCKEAKVVLDGRKRPSRDSTSTQTLSASQQPWPIQRMQQRRRTQLVGLRSMCVALSENNWRLVRLIRNIIPYGALKSFLNFNKAILGLVA